MRSLRKVILMTVGMLTVMQFTNAARIKDITEIKGSRDNQLKGFGLIVGLAGQGDGRIDYTEAAILNSLKRFGVNVDKADKAKNVAAVMITADIGPFAKSGSRIDVKVASIGDAESLQGGVLLQTPLKGADGKVYAVAQGPVAVGGFKLGGGGGNDAGVQKNHPTVGVVANGAIVEREIPMDITNNGSIDLVLHNPDYLTAVRISDVINSVYDSISLAKDFASINVRVPPEFRGQEVNFIAALGGLEVSPDTKARIVINERTGTIVATSSVKISPVAISHGALTLSVGKEKVISQPNALAGDGNTVNETLSTADVGEDSAEKSKFMVLDPEEEKAPTIDRLSKALNSLGVTTRDMASILQEMKKAGAIQAELIVN